MLVKGQEVGNFGTWEWNISQNVTKWSEYLYRIFGVSHEYFNPNAYDKFLELIHPNDQEILEKIMNQAIEDKKPFEIEYRIVKSDQELRYINARGRLITDEVGNLKMIGSSQDITDRKKAEQKLKESEEKYRLLFESSPVGIGISEFKGNVVAMNKKMNEMTGFTLEELNNIGLAATFVDQNKREKLLNELERSGQVRNCEVQLKKIDDTNYFASLNIDVIEFGGEKFLLTNQEDITERKIAEEKAIKERENAELYLNLVNVIVVALDNDGIITLMNKKGYEIVGYEKSELNGKNWFKTCLPPHGRDRVYDYFKKLMNGEMDVIEFYENSIYTKAGDERLIAWSTVLLKDRNGKITGLLSSGEDITKRKQAEDAY